MIIETEDNVYEDDYIFGAVSNSTSLAGILTLDPEYVDMGDGLFELLLVKSPKNLIDLTEIVHMLTTQNYDSGMLTFVNSDRFRVHASEDIPWSLDGEYQEGASEIFIENLHKNTSVIAYTLIIDRGSLKYSTVLSQTSENFP